MATLAEKMAASLEVLKELQDTSRCVILNGTNKISRTHLTRLLDNGWLHTRLPTCSTQSPSGQRCHAGFVRFAEK